jgi:molecular chaperone GrpE
MVEKPEIPVSETTDPEVLKQELEAAKKKADEYYDQLLRLKAEFENFRKRVEREKMESRAWGKQDVMLPLINLVDVFEQALGQAEKAKDMKHVIQGLQMLHTSFEQFLKTEGLQPISMAGKTFDPHLAEAVEQEEVDEAQVGNVLAEIQKGYMFQGRVLRPSRVRVGVAKKIEDQ